MKVKQITSESVKITNVDTSTGNVTYKDEVTGVITTVPKGMATPSGQGQVQISAQQVAPGQLGSAAQPTVKVGDTVNVMGQTPQTQQTMGTMEEGGEDDFDDNTTTKQVRQMASWLENRWGSYEDWGLEELQSIADELNISVEEVVDALGLDSSKLDAEMAETEETSVAQVDQPEDDPQMEAIKRLAGL